MEKIENVMEKLSNVWDRVVTYLEIQSWKGGQRLKKLSKQLSPRIGGQCANNA